MSEVENILELARLQLSPEEKARFTEEFKSIISFFKQLESVSTEGVKPLVTPVDIEFKGRVDEAQVSNLAERVLEQSPEREGGFFKVPPVL